MCKRLQRYILAFNKLFERITNLVFMNEGQLEDNKAPKKSRTYLTANSTLQINASTKLEAQKVTSCAKELLKKYINEPEKLLKFIESKGTIVIKAPHMDKVLLFAGEAEGFIYPAKGLRALYLIIMINLFSEKKLKFGFKTPAMFVMRKLPMNIYFLSHQIHHWLAYVKGLPGYEERTLSNFRNVWRSDFGQQDINRMSINDILALKDAIARDVEAINFVKEMARELIGQKNSMAKLKEGKSVNL